MLDSAQFITAACPADAFILSCSVRLDSTEPVSRAVLRGTARGIFEARIDGRPVSEAVLSPGWSAYEWRLPVEEYDVRLLMRDGARVEILVGNGWWRGKLGFLGMDLDYGATTGFIGELEVEHEDGTVHVFATGPEWTASSSSFSYNNLYHGARIDAAHESKELGVRCEPFDHSVLVRQVKPPIERQETLAPQKIWTSPSGKTLVDFGQNLVGWTRLRAAGQRGGEITVRHAEVLENDELSTRPLRGAQATDTYVLSGGDDIFEPTLTFHGFRYAEVSGFPTALTTNDIDAIVVHSRMDRTGTFECSDPRLNRLVENAAWGQKGNFIDVPTDCPQRDERLGWTGDISVFASTAVFQFNCADILHGWLLDLKAETEHSGYVPFVVPDLLKLATPETLGPYAALFGPTAIWGDAAMWVPEALWWAYGDRTRLEAHYPAMVLHLESILPRLSDEGLWDTGFQFGDWLDPTAPPERPLAAKADSAVVATACLYRSALFAEQTAGILGHHEDQQRWGALADRTRSAFRSRYVRNGGSRIQSDAQTVYALAVHFGLLEDSEKARAGARLAELVVESGYRVSTGFAGTPYITWALSETGHVDAAYRLLLQNENPSWLYAVEMGATTIWERWDSLLPDGSVNPGEMTSFNHYALGAVVDWLYKCVAGIRPAEPGYASVRLQPVPGPGLDWARAALDAPSGRVECGWQRLQDGVITVNCSVPPGVKAELQLPDGTVRLLGEGTHQTFYREEQ